MKVFIGADHRGFHLKESLRQWLTGLGHDVSDCGATSYNVADDYPDFTFAVADAVIQNPESRGIVICGSGIGVTIAANKVKGIRAAFGMNKDVVEHSRMHDDCHILALSADHTTEDDAKEMIEIFFTTAFDSQERFTRRLKKIQEREN